MSRIPDSVYAHSTILEKQRGKIRDLEEKLEVLTAAVFPDGAPDSEPVEPVTDPPVTDADLFDPTQHTVAEVTAYLNKVSAEPTDENKAEVERVLAAERAGEHRKGLVGERPA